MTIVFATFSTWVTPTVMINKGEAWDERDPVVRSHPDWFSPTPPEVRTSAAAVFTQESASRARPVEQATANPGEVRSRTDAALDETEQLRQRLTDAGLKPDRRWSLERLRQEAAKVAGA